MLIAQELTYYGLDIYKERKLADLLRALSDVDGIEWIRLHYAYPSKFPLDIFDAMKDLPKVCNYIDMPLQHANNDILKRMKRQITREQTVALVEEARKRVPNITFRTTLLVGFPGETEAEFQDMVDFVQEMKFERVGVFQYSHEENTAAYDVEDDVPADVKEARAATLMSVQEQISWENNQAKIGQQFKVLFDRIEGEFFVGRTEFDSPEVDNEVLVTVEDNFVRIGDFAKIEITDATEYDLYGTVVS